MYQLEAMKPCNCALQTFSLWTIFCNGHTRHRKNTQNVYDDTIKNTQNDVDDAFRMKKTPDLVTPQKT
jgi:hypothetical protein